MASSSELQSSIVYDSGLDLQIHGQIALLDRNSSRKPPFSPAATCTGDDPYEGVPATKVKTIFRAACTLRHAQPDPNDIRLTGTELDEEIVACILEGALRLLPPDKSAAGTHLRQEKMRIKQNHAERAEQHFVEQVRACFPSMENESEQHQRIQRAIEQGQANIIKMTPDILFSSEESLYGIQCRWIEYKNLFGFKKNPFLHSKHLKQYRRYRATFGQGIVIYKLGYESDLFKIEGIRCIRESDFVTWMEGGDVICSSRHY